MEKKILEYDVVCKDYVHELIQDVNKLIEKGWQPYGNMVKVEKTGYVYQPMVRYEKWA